MIRILYQQPLKINFMVNFFYFSRKTQVGKESPIVLFLTKLCLLVQITLKKLLLNLLINWICPNLEKAKTKTWDFFQYFISSQKTLFVKKEKESTVIMIGWRHVSLLQVSLQTTFPRRIPGLTWRQISQVGTFWPILIKNKLNFGV